MDHQIFEPLVGKEHFEDCSNRFYRFLAMELWHFSPLHSGEDEKGRLYLPTRTTERTGEVPGVYNPNYHSASPVSKITLPKHRRASFKKQAASVDLESMINCSKCTTLESITRSPLSLLNKDFTRKISQSSSCSQTLGRRHSFTLALQSRFQDSSNNKLRNLSQLQPCLKRKNSFLTRSSLRVSLARLKPRILPREHSSAVQLTGQKLGDFDENQKVQEHIRERALSRLLTLVDIPVLEPILMTPYNLPKVSPSKETVIIQNEVTHSSFTKSVVRQALWRIPWVELATACMDGPPEGIDKLWSAQACKLHCYQAVVEYCHRLPSSVFPVSYLQIYLAIIKLLRENKPTQAQEVVQLLLVILPWQRRHQLLRLLQFLDLVSNDVLVVVDKQLSNHEAILRDFSDIVLSHLLISLDHSCNFLDFLISRIPSLLSLPEWLTTHSITEGPVFCQQIIREQHTTITAQALQQLMNSVLNSNISEKRKRSWIKKFEKAHPEQYYLLFPVH
ncbi:DEP domain-containing protein 7-like isoform X2 [Tachypleus tridentatus]